MDEKLIVKENDTEEIKTLKQQAWIMSSTLNEADKQLKKMSGSLISLQTKGLQKSDLVALLYGRNTAFGKRNIEMVINALFSNTNLDVQSFLNYFGRGIKVNEVARILADLKTLINKYQTK